MDDSCTCGQIGIHRRQIDGKMYTLCGECNAVLECIRANFYGMSVLRAARLSTADEDDTFLKMSGMPAFVYEPTEPQAQPPAAVPQPIVVHSAPVQYDPFVPPIPDNFHEKRRQPPEVHHGEEEGQVEDQGGHG